VLERLDENSLRLEEASARLAEIERYLAGLRPDAEKFAHEIGPIVLATKNLREEISQHKDEVKRDLQEHLKKMTATLKLIESQIGQHRTNIESDIEQADTVIGASEQMVKQGTSLLQQSMTIYTKSTQSVEDVALKSTKHIEATAQRASRMLDEQSGRLKKDMSELEEMYYRMRDWLFAKTLVIGIISAMIGALAGGLMISLYTASRIDAIAETQRNSERWKYLIDRQNKKTPGSGDEFNRRIEVEMKLPENGEGQGANK
jgi:DNA repair exonuclease SbcCD ATPase subunit